VFVEKNLKIFAKGVDNFFLFDIMCALCKK